MTAFETVCGWVALFLGVACLLLMYHKVMQSMYKDFSHEEADELFDDYVRHCEFHVHTKLHTQIVDETK